MIDFPRTDNREYIRCFLKNVCQGNLKKFYTLCRSYIFKNAGDSSVML
jgi:hypothetical protein